MPKGVYKRTEEGRENMSKAAKKRPPMSEETKLKMSEKMKGVPKSDSHKMAISKAKKGKRFSPEHIEKLILAAKTRPSISNETRVKMSISHTGHETSEETRKKIGDAQRGGKDGIQHHYIYDDSDPSKYTIGMTRSDHTSLHRLLQKLGYIIPHINHQKVYKV